MTTDYSKDPVAMALAKALNASIADFSDFTYAADQGDPYGYQVEGINWEIRTWADPSMREYLSDYNWWMRHDMIDCADVVFELGGYKYGAWECA